jgi:hypothetical protein
MATTTPNYGWTVPTSTDLVKDGATAIETLGDAIDASMNTALGTKKAGMVLLNTTSFSAVSAVNLPADTFTSTYENYRVVANLTSSVLTAFLQVRLRAAGSDNTTSNYYNMTQGLDGSGNSFVIAANTQTTWSLFYLNNNGNNSMSIDICRPKETAITNLFGTGASVNAAGSGYAGNRIGSLFSLTTSFDSCSFIASTGTITGELSVYGYNQ